MKKIHLFIWVVAIFTGLVSCAYLTSLESGTDYKVLCITRHSARGVNFFNGQQVSLPNDIILRNPFFTWNDDLTCEGHDLVSADAVNTCVQAGFDELQLGKWKKQWTEIRVNFLYEGTYVTGRILKKRLGNPDIKLTAVIDKDKPNQVFSYNSDNYDSVTYTMQAGGFPTSVPPFPSCVDAAILQMKAREFINELSLALGKEPYTGTLPDVFLDGIVSPFYQQNMYVATDLIIMSAFSNKPPLNVLFKNEKEYPHQRRLVKAACDFQRYFSENYYSTQFTVYNSFPIIEYLNSMKLNNTGKIIVTENARQLELLKSLNIETYPYTVPYQCYIIIQTQDKVCIMVVSPKISKRGIFSKQAFFTRLIWKGSLEEWQEKIQNMTHYVEPIYPLYPVKEAYELIIE